MNQQLEDSIKQQNHPRLVLNTGFAFGDGWSTIVERLVRELSYLLELHEDVTIYVDQAKEKFGSLRWYWHMETNNEHSTLYEIITDLVCFACTESSHTCELCGRPGKIVSPRFWMRCLCDTHEQEAKEQK
jgi:hypothetical protein